MILDGKKVRNELLEYYENKIKEENIKITLAIIYVGSDEPSKIYINNKIKYCEKVGIKTLLYEMDEKTKEKEVIDFFIPDNTIIEKYIIFESDTDKANTLFDIRYKLYDYCYIDKMCWDLI